MVYISRHYKKYIRHDSSLLFQEPISLNSDLSINLFQPHNSKAIFIDCKSNLVSQKCAITLNTSTAAAAPRDLARLSNAAIPWIARARLHVLIQRHLPVRKLQLALIILLWAKSFLVDEPKHFGYLLDSLGR